MRFFLFCCWHRLGLRRPLGKQWVFAQVEPITQNKLGLPLYSLHCFSSLSPPHSLISRVWVVIWKPGQTHSEPLLPNKQASNGCLPRVQEPLCAWKLNISDSRNGRRQITVALPWGIDWKNAECFPNCYQQLYMLVKALQMAYQLDGVKTQIKNFCCAITLHSRADDLVWDGFHHIGCLGVTGLPIRKCPCTSAEHHTPLFNHLARSGQCNGEIWSTWKMKVHS